MSRIKQLSPVTAVSMADECFIMPGLITIAVLAKPVVRLKKAALPSRCFVGQETDHLEKRLQGKAHLPRAAALLAKVQVP